MGTTCDDGSGCNSEMYESICPDGSGGGGGVDDSSEFTEQNEASASETKPDPHEFKPLVWTGRAYLTILQPKGIIESVHQEEIRVDPKDDGIYDALAQKWYYRTVHISGAWSRHFPKPPTKRITLEWGCLSTTS